MNRPLSTPLAATIVFIEACAVLILEILSVRLLAPYVGLTLETTTSIIGAVLLGIAVGAGVGGWVADRTNPPRLIFGLLIGGGGLTLLTVPIIRWLGPMAMEKGTGGALIVTLVALVPVAAVLSAISPTVTHWRLRDLQSSGTVVGGLSAWGTAGALVGTFGAGFVLVPFLPVSITIISVGALLVVTGVIFGGFMNLFSTDIIAGFALIPVMVGGVGPLLPSPCVVETSYHCVNVTRVPGYPTGRYLYLDTERNSFIDLNDPSDLGTFRYMQWIANAIEGYEPGTPLSMVVVGGGAFTLPRWLQAVRPGSTSTTLEVDGQLVRFDKQHLGLHTSPSLQAVVGDARLSIHKQPTGSADVVIGDAFSGLTMPWQLTTVEWLREVRRVLKPGGFYAENMIDKRPLALLRAESATLLTVFSNVQLIAIPGKGGSPAGGNAVLFASNAPLPLSRTANLAGGATVYDQRDMKELAAGVLPLTDNYAPVDQLQTR